jgi:glycosyltransferase involved in cell wall biosynthesis
VLRALFAQIEAFLAIGTLNREFYRFYGAEQAKIFQVPYTVDNQYFSMKTSEFRERRAELRATYGLGDQVVFLFAAKMIPKKQPLELLQAFRMLHDVPQAALLMVGDGELREQAEKYVTEHNLVNVHFVGFVNQSQLPKYYAMSDVFVRPDGVYQGDWGLTVNEAMAAGLAVIATDKIGASVDLIRNNQNGFKVRFGDLQDLAGAIRKIATQPGLAQAMGAQSAEIIQTWSYEECVQGVKSALRQLSNGGK